MEACAGGRFSNIELGMATPLTMTRPGSWLLESDDCRTEVPPGEEKNRGRDEGEARDG